MNRENLQMPLADECISRGNQFMASMVSDSKSIQSTRALELLLIDDDIELCELMERFLTSRNIRLEVVHDGRRGLSRALGSEHDLILLDVMLPALDGFEVVRQVRRRSTMPIIMLTARTGKEDRIAGLEGGADDYLPKPFDPEELIARVRAVVRRVTRPALGDLDVIDVNRVRLTPGSREIRANGKPVEVTTMLVTVGESTTISVGVGAYRYSSVSARSAQRFRSSRHESETTGFWRESARGMRRLEAR